jgi:general secretion pathway protein F
LAAGLPLEEALAAAAAQADQGRAQSLLLGVRGRILEGQSFAQALGAYPAAFDDLYRATVAAGEQAGHLDRVLDALARFTERQQETGQSVQMALLYPILLLVLSLAIVLGILTYVVPELVGVYAETGQALPLLTRGLLALAGFLDRFALILTGAGALLAFGAYRAYGLPSVRQRIETLLLNGGPWRGLTRGLHASRFSSTLAILTASGVPLLEGLRIAGDVLTNGVLKARVASARQTVAEGTSLHQALRDVGYFPPLMLHMVASGEASGQLEHMLERVASHLERDNERLVTAFLELLKPLTLVFMGGLVLLIVLAIMLPILNLNQLAV